MKVNYDRLRNVYKGDIVLGEIEITGDPEIVYEDKYIIIVKDPVIFPDGTVGTHLRITEISTLEGSTGTVVVPYSKKSIFMINIFRHPIRKWSIELPRGGRKNGELISECGYRELKEELGLEIEKHDARNVIGYINANTGILNDKINIMKSDVDGLIKDMLTTPVSKKETIAYITSIPMCGTNCVDDQIALGKIHDAVTIAAYTLFKCKHPYLFERF